MSHHDEIIRFFTKDEFTDVELNQLYSSIRNKQLTPSELDSAYQFIEANLKVFETIQRKEVENYFGTERTGKRKRIIRKEKDKKLIVKTKSVKRVSEDRSKRDSLISKAHKKPGAKGTSGYKKGALGYKPGKVNSRQLPPGVYGKIEKFGPGKIIYIRSR